MVMVGKILVSKPIKTTYSIAPNASILDAMRLMYKHSIGGLVVMEKEEIVGIITERDYARKLGPSNRTLNDLQVRDVMTTPVISISPEQTSNECLTLMTENQLRHLPVVEDGKLIGMISISDLVRDVMPKQDFIIEQLERYIRGDVGHPTHR